MKTFSMTSPYYLGTVAIALIVLLYYVWVHSWAYAYVVDRWGWEEGNRFLRIESAFFTFACSCSLVFVLLECFETLN